MSDFKKIQEEASLKATPEFCKQLHGIVEGGEQTRVRIPILGGMKAGKSTLLANLLACDHAYLPPGVLEATARNVFVNWGFAANRKIEHTDGTETSVAEDSEWDGLVRGNAGVLNEGDRLVIELPSDILANGALSFVDTPGNNTIDGDKSVETWTALADAQLAVYCIRATSMLTKSDVAFLRTAEHKLNNFVVVVTRLDEAGITDVASAEANALVDYARQRIVEAIGREPLNILPVSSVISGAASGITGLGEFLVRTVRQSGQQLRDDRVRMDISSLAKEYLPKTQNEILLLEKSGEANAEEVQCKLGDLQAKLSDSESDRDNALRRLAADLENRKVLVRGEIGQVARQAFERVRSRVGAITSADELESSSGGLILSECEQLQTEIKDILSRERNDGQAILQTAATDFLQGLEMTVREKIGIDFKVTLTDPEQYEVSASLREESQKLAAEGAKVAREIESLRGEIANDADMLPELQHNLMVAQQEAQNIQYVPQYVENPQAKHPGAAETALAGVGEALDWLLLFTPIPSNKLKWLSKLRYGTKISKVIKQTNKIVRAKNRLVKNVVNTLPIVGPVLDMFSAEAWLRKVGKVIDGPSQAPEMIEDPETRRAYEMAMEAAQSKQRAISADIIRAESDLKGKNIEIERLQQQGERAEATRLELEKELQERMRSLKTLREEARLVEGRTQLVQRAAELFALSSDLLKPVVEGVERALAQAYEDLSKELVASMTATIESIRKQVADFNLYRAQNDTDRKNRIDALRDRLSFYQSLILEKHS